jgi:phosphoribosylamine--glycine ligase
MKILVLGSGGREHVLAWKLGQSPKCSKLYVAPGNAGTSQVATNIPVAMDDFSAITDTVRNHDIDLLVVGPEAPLAEGIRDHLQKQKGLEHLLIVGPGQQGAALESSKDYAKRFMQRHKIPAAASRSFGRDDYEMARAYVQTQPLPVVLKADGLAAGKGVIICEDQETAQKTLKSMLLDEMFGEASNKVVVEEFLSGIELSVFVLTDGVDYMMLPEAKDYKPVGDNNTGPNTGGMGSVSPVNFAQGAFLDKVEQRIIQPTIEGLKKDGIDYRGFIFFGLMNVEGEPYVIEYNVRMGDPEAQVVLPRMKNDFVDLMVATAKGGLKSLASQTDPRTAVTVIMASGGYPASYEKGHEIHGIPPAPSDTTVVFHAGTTVSDTRVVNNGGRVLAVTGFAKGLKDAIETAYETVDRISWKDAYCRRDIGMDLLQLEK